MTTGVFKRMGASIGRRILRVGAAVGVAALLAAPVAATAQTLAALPSQGLSATTSGTARPILAWTDFCKRYPSECAIDRDGAATVTLTPATWQTINTINRRVNRSIQAVTDQEHWGAPDRWDLAEDGKADCEDFQLLKRRLLADAGLSRRAMRMTVVIDEMGEGHAVLTILTTRGDLILDNKTNAVLPWTQTGYTFIKRESQDSLAWVSLGHTPSPVTTANR